MEIRTDRLGILVEQLSDSAELSKARFEGLTDGEYRWEPVDGMWSVRHRDEVTTSNAFGPGDWVLDRELVGGPFDPGPLSTIAWRLGHLASGIAGRWEWTFGSRSIDPAEALDFSPTAEGGLTALFDATDRWVAGLETVTDEQLDEVGFSQYPWGLDANLPFVGIVRWVNREFIHHCAEIALMRDLYAAADTWSG